MRHMDGRIGAAMAPMTVRIIAATSSDGRPAFEEVLVESLGASRYRIVKSPGLALNLAADDVFSLRPDGSYWVESRGGNVCIQMYAESITPEMEDGIISIMRDVHGRLDGKTVNVLVFTVPVSSKFPQIEAALSRVVSRFSNVEWYYGNVYDPDDGVTPLDWWKPNRC